MNMQEWISLDQIRRYAVPIALVIIVALLVLRFARPFIRRILGRLFKKVKAGEQWQVTGELRRRILSAFAHANISLPHRNVLIERDSNENWSGDSRTGNVPDADAD